MVKPAGTVIDGRYRIVRFLGQGSFGEVYAVRDEHQDADCALKFLNSTPAGSGVWQEAQILTQLRSDYILPVRNADFDVGAPYLVTDLAVNGAATNRMPPYGADPVQAIRWIRSASRGAARTHDANLVHRDIKPDNIFITASDEGLLGDFGIAHIMDAAGNAPPGGTLLTMAPEVVRGGATSIRSDVYSLGATLYRLLSGRFPAEHPDAAQLAALVAAGNLTHYGTSRHICRSRSPSALVVLSLSIRPIDSTAPQSSTQPLGGCPRRSASGCVLMSTLPATQHAGA